MVSALLQFLSDVQPQSNVLEFVTQCRECLYHACAIAKKSLSAAQGKMKWQHDTKAVQRSFKPGDQVLMLVPTSGPSLSAQFAGPYVVESKVNGTNYIVRTPDRRRKTRLCHINMLKLFHSREDDKEGSISLISVPINHDDGLVKGSEGQQSGRLANSEVLDALDTYLSYLPHDEKDDVKNLIQAHPSLFGDVPSRTPVLKHNIDVGDACPIKQHTYSRGS